jgi:hypothetical protein
VTVEVRRYRPASDWMILTMTMASVPPVHERHLYEQMNPISPCVPFSRPYLCELFFATDYSKDHFVQNNTTPHVPEIIWYSGGARNGLV